MNLEIQIEILKTDKDGKTADNHGNIGHGTELPQPFAGFSLQRPVPCRYFDSSV